MGTAFTSCLGDFYPNQRPNGRPGDSSGAPEQPPSCAVTAGQERSLPQSSGAVDLRKPGETGADANSESTQLSKCAFGAGCYWGTEKFLKIEFPKKTAAPWRKHAPGQITKGEVGFMGPKNAPPNPSYEVVCSGSTGHVEVFHVEYEGGDAYFEEMVRYFFQFHDPTTVNKQGNDAGTQYASVIFCYTESQVKIANKVKDELQQHLQNGLLPPKCYKEERVVTRVQMAEGPFYPAHDAHQEYLMKNPRGYCNHRIRFKDWPKNGAAKE